MMEETLPSILDSVHRWLTPTVLFVFINLVIGTIAIASRSSHRDQDQPPLLRRAPSLVLERLRSFNLPSAPETLAWFHPSPAPNPAAPPAVPVAEEPSKQEKRDRQRSLVRSKSEGKPAVGVRKSESETTPEFAQFEEEREAEGGVEEEEDDEVDVRADDFISRFRNQLWLQRQESIMRRREMLHA